MREVKAMKKPGCPVCGPRGVAYDQGQRTLSNHCVLLAPHHTSYVSGCQDYMGPSALNVHGHLQSVTAQPNMPPESMAARITKMPLRKQTVVTRMRCRMTIHPLPRAHHQMVMMIRVKTELTKRSISSGKGDTSLTKQRR